MIGSEMDTAALSAYLQMRADRAQRAREAAQRVASHADDPSMLIGREIEILRAPVEVNIDYSDAEARPSRRAIQIRRYDGHYIGAYCLMRRAHRTFIVDRVQSAADADGVVIDDFPAFLEVFFGNDSLLDEARQRQRYWRRVEAHVAPELLLLRILAAADGILSPAESEIIADQAFALMEKKEIPGERAGLLRYVRRLSGTAETVNSALIYMTTQSRARRRRFGEAALRLIEADGSIDDAEIDVLRLFEAGGAFG